MVRRTIFKHARWPPQLEALKGFVDYCNFPLDNAGADVFCCTPYTVYSYGRRHASALVKDILFSLLPAYLVKKRKPKGSRCGTPQNRQVPAVTFPQYLRTSTCRLCAVRPTHSPTHPACVSWNWKPFSNAVEPDPCSSSETCLK